MGMEPESLFYNEAALEAKARQDALLDEVKRRRAARSLVLPTHDHEVKIALRIQGEPIALFGEDVHDRRERLRAVLAKSLNLENEAAELDTLAAPADPTSGLADGEAQGREQEEFYTEGSDGLKRARQALLPPSLQRAKERLKNARNRNAREFKEEGDRAIMAALEMRVSASTIGDERPLSCCALSRPHADATLLAATGSFSGDVKVWNVPDSTIRCTLTGHKERVSEVAFHPTEPHFLLSGAADKTARIWSSLDQGKEVLVLKGHVDRVAGVAFHPFANNVATASLDSTWRLWDSETGQELLLQEGHSKPVFKVSFHCDGGLLGSTGWDGVFLLWDVRSGKNICSLSAHIGKSLALDFSPNGYLAATGGEDNLIKIWDLRKRKVSSTIAAHTNLVSCVRFHGEGHLLISSSFDRSCRVWSQRGWLHVRTLDTFEEKVTSCDISEDGSMIVTSSFDRTWKLWSKDS